MSHAFNVNRELFSWHFLCNFIELKQKGSEPAGFPVLFPNLLPILTVPSSGIMDRQEIILYRK